MPTVSIDHVPDSIGPSPSSSMEAVQNDKYNHPHPSKLENSNTLPLPSPSDDVNFTAKKSDIPPSPRSHRRRNTTAPERRTGGGSSSQPPVSPSLYTTPESTPLPDSPTSPFPSLSPYVINHKRRGPRLLKSSSEKNVAAAGSYRRIDEVDGRLYNGHHFRRLSEGTVSREIKEERSSDNEDSTNDTNVESKSNEQKGESRNGGSTGGYRKKVDLKILTRLSSNREVEYFFDSAETMGYTSHTDGEDCGGDQSARMYTPKAGELFTPVGEFYDAWEELSAENGRQRQRSLFNAEIELREIRLNLLTEIEKRKHAEDALNSMQNQWQVLREKVLTVGLNLPVDLSDVNLLEDICEQVNNTRSASESIGRAAAKAEAEEEIRAQMEAKNFEIARLTDRLHFYDTMNREMSQRNQEAIEITRRERQNQRIKQEWIWGSIGAAITLASAVLVCVLTPGAKGASSSIKTDTKPQR